MSRLLHLAVSLLVVAACDGEGLIFVEIANWPEQANALYLTARINELPITEFYTHASINSELMIVRPPTPGIAIYVPTHKAVGIELFGPLCDQKNVVISYSHTEYRELSSSLTAPGRLTLIWEPLLAWQTCSQITATYPIH